MSNWGYDTDSDAYACSNEQKLIFCNHSKRKDTAEFECHFKVYECEDCSDCPFRSMCTSEGTNRTLSMNKKWEEQKTYVSEKLLEEKLL